MEANTPSPTPSERYASILRAVTRVGLLVLVVGFFVYVSGWTDPRVAARDLPGLWGKPAQAYLAAAGIAPGWGWLRAVMRGDSAPLLGIALIALSPLCCLVGVLPLYLKARDGALSRIVAVLILLLMLAASGLPGSSG